MSYCPLWVLYYGGNKTMEFSIVTKITSNKAPLNLVATKIKSNELNTAMDMVSKEVLKHSDEYRKPTK